MSLVYSSWMEYADVHEACQELDELMEEVSGEIDRMYGTLPVNARCSIRYRVQVSQESCDSTESDPSEHMQDELLT